MRTTIRSSTFETNSSSSHTYIRASKEDYEAWKRGEKVLDGKYNAETQSTEYVITDKSGLGDDEGRKHTYEDIQKYYSMIGGDSVPLFKAYQKHVDTDEWEECNDRLVLSMRKVLKGIEEWKDYNDDDSSAFREAVRIMKKKTEIKEEDIDWFLGVLCDMDKKWYLIPDRRFKRLREMLDSIWCDYDLEQSKFMDTDDDGENVTVHIWGRC